jgi:calcineurin-like phosphoesterase family protein
MSVFLCSDLHLGHTNLIIHKRGFKTVEEHDNLIISNWNSVVHKNDKVFLLGDIAMETYKYYELLASLKGIIHVIPGNHESPTHVKHLLKYVNVISGNIKYKEFWLSHIPIHPDELRGKVNIHGHVHERSINDPRYVNVSMEVINYTPISIDEIRKGIPK